MKLNNLIVYLTSCILFAACNQTAETPIEKFTSISTSEVNYQMNPNREVPSFIRCSIPVSEYGFSSISEENKDQLIEAVMGRHSDLFGFASVPDLTFKSYKTDELGTKIFTYDQTFQGNRIYTAGISLFVSATDTLKTIVSSLIPNVEIAIPDKIIEENEAVRIASLGLDSVVIMENPFLNLYVDAGGYETGDAARLCWFVHLRSASTMTNEIIVLNATSGKLEDNISLIKDVRDRNTYNGANTGNLPGTLARTESSPPTGNRDIDDAHDFAGEFYNYFIVNHNRDSYDGNSATMKSVANHKPETDKEFRNAFWNGLFVVYGNNMATRDIVAHELTHAVSDNSTADFVYRWQSGALSESYSDIFAVMIDDDNWLIGEGCALGVIRNVSSPTSYGQPEETSGWWQTCKDSEGVHTNSGIHNKAFFNVVTALGREKAARIFYRALVTYLRPTSSLEDSRNSCMQAAEDIFGPKSDEFYEVYRAFHLVGLDGSFAPRALNCGNYRRGTGERQCGVAYAMSNENNTSEEEDQTMLTVLRRFRDEVLLPTEVGNEFDSLYYEHSFTMLRYFSKDDSLRDQTVELLKLIKPGVESMLKGSTGNELVDQKVIDAVLRFTDKFKQADGQGGTSTLSQWIESKVNQVDPPTLIGMTYQDAWKKVQQN